MDVCLGAHKTHVVNEFHWSDPIQKIHENPDENVCCFFILGVSPLYSQAQNIENEEARDIQTLVRTLDADLVAFQFLPRQSVMQNNSHCSRILIAWLFSGPHQHGWQRRLAR